MAESGTVTAEEQRAHIREIKRLAKKIRIYQKKSPGSGYISIPLSRDEAETIQRALACHLCVITLDIQDREERKKALEKLKQTGEKIPGEDYQGEKEISR